MTSNEIFDAIKDLQQIKMSVKFREGKSDILRVSRLEESVDKIADILQQMLTERERSNGITGNTRSAT